MPGSTQSNEKAEGEEDLGKRDCPLTTGEWITFLTAESRANIEFIITTVAIILAAYAATSFGKFGILIRLILLLFFGLAIISIFCAEIIVILKSEEYNRIVKNIISGELTDSNEIRRQWERKNKYDRKRRKIM